MDTEVAIDSNPIFIFFNVIFLVILYIIKTDEVVNIILRGWNIISIISCLKKIRATH